MEFLHQILLINLPAKPVPELYPTKVNGEKTFKYPILAESPNVVETPKIIQAINVKPRKNFLVSKEVKGFYP